MIKVKKLVWDDNLNASSNETNGYMILSWEDKFKIINWDFGNRDADDIGMCDTFQEAKEYVQQLWDEYVLSLVEE